MPSYLMLKKEIDTTRELTLKSYNKKVVEVFQEEWILMIFLECSWEVAEWEEWVEWAAEAEVLLLARVDSSILSHSNENNIIRCEYLIFDIFRITCST